jgi:hypothetical protein
MVARAGGLHVAPGQGFFYLNDRRCIGGHEFFSWCVGPAGAPMASPSRLVCYAGHTPR